MGTAVLLPQLLGLRRSGALPASADDGSLDPLLHAPRVSGGRVGAEVMVSQVVPVWGKQLDITREAAADGLGLLLEGISQMATALGDLAQQIEHSQVTLAPGAVDAALAADSPAQAAGPPVRPGCQCHTTTGTLKPEWPPAPAPSARCRGHWRSRPG